MFIRWAQHGAWERLLGLAQERAGGRASSLAFLDGTNVRAHAKAAGAPKKATSAGRDQREALGRFRGGFGAQPAIPAKRNEAAQRCPDFIHVHRNRVERLWGRLKQWRAVATPYERAAHSFMGVLCLAAARGWLKPSIKHQSPSPDRT